MKNSIYAKNEIPRAYVRRLWRKASPESEI